MASAVKLSDELVNAARRASRTWSRSMTQQIEHWARIGRAVERGGHVSLERIRAALEAQVEFDTLNADERLTVLGELERAVFDPRGDERLTRALRSEGVPTSGIDEQGRLVTQSESKDAEPVGDAETYGEALRRTDEA
jgi:hypothetical protein